MIYRSEIIKTIMDRDGIVPSSNPLYESEIIAQYLTNGVNEYESELLNKMLDTPEQPEQPEHPNILNSVTLEAGGDASFFPYKTISYRSLEYLSSGSNINETLDGNNYGFVFKITSPKMIRELFSGTSTYLALAKVDLIDGEFFKNTLVLNEVGRPISINVCLVTEEAYNITLDEGYYLCSFYYQPSNTFHFNDGVLVNVADVPILESGEMM